MSKNNEYKQGYKFTPLGWLPKEWEVKELGDVCNIYVGRDLKTEHFSSIQTEEHKYPVFSNTVENVGLYGFYKIGEYKGESLTIVGRGAGLGKAFTRNGSYGAIGRLLVLFPQSGIAAHYVTEYVNCILRIHQESSGIPQLTGEQISGYNIILPPNDEQGKIAAILSTWDEAITKTQQLIAQLQQRNIGLMQQLLAPKTGWKEYRIGDLLKEVKRPVSWDDNELYNLISVRRRSGGAFFRQSLYGKQILTKQLFTAEQGDFLISKMQIVHGASAVVPPQFAGMKISGSYIAVHSKDDNIIDMNFFNWLSKTPWFYRLTYISSYGVHIEKMTFDFNDFKRHKMMLPATVDEQKHIVSILQTASDEVKLQEQKLAALQQQKKGLMQKLLTGEIRVKVTI